MIVPENLCPYCGHWPCSPGYGACIVCLSDTDYADYNPYPPGYTEDDYYDSYYDDYYEEDYYDEYDDYVDYYEGEYDDEGYEV